MLRAVGHYGDGLFRVVSTFAAARLSAAINPGEAKKEAKKRAPWQRPAGDMGLSHYLFLVNESAFAVRLSQ
ncbi:hypothetical protein LNQ03_28185 [Klebsiella pneumoniae subsp. pneumoniae]|nr:hypothetical protein [Klebsiella pneumoniae subsp. pneumoniae]